MGVTFTDRELEVIRLLSDGETTKTIASKLGIFESDALRLRAIIFAKAGAKNAAHLVKIAITEKLI